MKTDGDIHMYAIENDPRDRAAIVGFDKRLVALPIRGKGIGAIAGYGNVISGIHSSSNAKHT